MSRKFNHITLIVSCERCGFEFYKKILDVDKYRSTIDDLVSDHFDSLKKFNVIDRNARGLQNDHRYLCIQCADAWTTFQADQADAYSRFRDSLAKTKEDQGG